TPRSRTASKAASRMRDRVVERASVAMALNADQSSGGEPDVTLVPLPSHCQTRASAAGWTRRSIARLATPMELPEELSSRPPRQPGQEPSATLTLDAYR